MPPTPTTRTDDDLLATTDVAVLLRYGLTQDAFRTALFGDGAIAAAVTLDRLGVAPRSVSYVAKVVRAGGLRYAAELPEPLPSPEASALLRDWLETAAQLADGPEGEARVARWLDTVAEITGLRRGARARISDAPGTPGS
ncbi:hypothetical protein AQI88_34410 [Streptomyces cellostaticus]|uniref:Uncharacterized protein n=1 Tax=Streptomyces cellostaticus TaxID=67285 RepID=A0A101NET7_9ACTN|nr:hypothetical protein [Streptomyces cellostaticus]KUM91884.1 hypothetical protein AQI88_34410 [Streptomyces cellostaticus]GHI06967.1 hypothetical protein Scel_52880 [Streptomyces cellostaticus]